MNIQEKFWKSASLACLLLVIFLAVISIKELKSIGYVGKNLQTTNTISVEGTGDAVTIPDIATFSFMVTETAKTVADAQTQATAKIDNALKAVKDAGVDDKDIQTISYNINPHYEYQGVACSTNYCPQDKQVLTGYDVSESIQVKVRDLAKAGTIFSSIGSIGVQNVNGLNFSVDKPDAVQAEARAKAIANAQAKADKLADQLGVSLVRITSFNESTGGRPGVTYGMAYSSARAMDSVVVPAPAIPTGEQKVTSDVTITYEIK